VWLNHGNIICFSGFSYEHLVMLHICFIAADSVIALLWDDCCVDFTENYSINLLQLH
jgi:hypothetical protein